MWRTMAIGWWNWTDLGGAVARQPIVGWWLARDYTNLCIVLISNQEIMGIILGSAADSDPGSFITILIHVCLQCPTFCTFSFMLEICTRAFCPIFCLGACPWCAICIVVAMQTSVFSAWARFRTLILDALQLFWPTHLPDSFYDSSETERIAHTAQAVQHLLCPILHECLTLWAHTFSDGATPDRAIVSNHPTLCPT